MTRPQFADLLAEARNLGADIRPERMDHGPSYWICRNWQAINQRGLLAKWIEVEESRRVA